MSVHVEESEWDGTHFSREESTGVVLGLDFGQVGFLGVGVVIAVTLVIAFGFPVGFIGAVAVAGVFGVIGIPRYDGRSLLRWALVFISMWFRKKQGQNQFVQETDTIDATVDDAGEIVIQPTYKAVDGDSGEDIPRDKKGRIKPPVGQRMKLPGEFNELQMFQLPGGAAFVYDPRRREAMVSARILTEKAFHLEDSNRVEDRLRAWAAAQTAVAQIPGVIRLQCSDQTTIISGSKVLEWYESRQGREGESTGSDVNPFLDQSFVELMNQAEGQPVHELWMTVVLGQEPLKKRIQANGGRLRGFMETALSIMGVIEAAIPDSGARVMGWHTPRSMAALIRSAFDPRSSVEISSRRGDREGVAVSAAGPMHASWDVNRFESDGALHRTFKISEWPQSQAQLGFLDRLVFAGDFRHTVSVYIRPRDTRKAFKDVERRKADWETNDKLRRKAGRQQSLRHDRQLEDIEREETELVVGHAALKIACLITVSALSEQELEANSGDVRTRAAEAGCEVRSMDGEQDAAFVAGATPLGRLMI